MPLADHLKAATRELHGESERTGFIGALLRGGATREGYVLYLRNLLPVYQAMEAALERHEDGRMAALAAPSVRRATSLMADLRALVGPGWQGLPLLPSSQAYARRIAKSAAEERGEGLIGHAYTRYLGDLNGGQVLKRLLAHRMHLKSDALTFYAFPEIADLTGFAADYRTRIDSLGACMPAATAGIVEEARASFEASIAISMQVAEEGLRERTSQ